MSKPHCTDKQRGLYMPTPQYELSAVTSQSLQLSTITILSLQADTTLLAVCS